MGSVTGEDAEDGEHDEDAGDDADGDDREEEPDGEVWYLGSRVRR